MEIYSKITATGVLFTINSNFTELGSNSQFDCICKLSSQMSNKAKLWISCGPDFFFALWICKWNYRYITDIPLYPISDGNWFSGLFLGVASFVNFHSNKTGSSVHWEPSLHWHPWTPFPLKPKKATLPERRQISHSDNWQLHCTQMKVIKKEKQKAKDWCLVLWYPSRHN